MKRLEVSCVVTHTVTSSRKELCESTNWLSAAMKEKHCYLFKPFFVIFILLLCVSDLLHFCLNKLHMASANVKLIFLTEWNGTWVLSAAAHRTSLPTPDSTKRFVGWVRVQSFFSWDNTVCELMSEPTCFNVSHCFVFPLRSRFHLLCLQVFFMETLISSSSGWLHVFGLVLSHCLLLYSLLSRHSLAGWVILEPFHIDIDPQCMGLKLFTFFGSCKCGRCSFQ